MEEHERFIKLDDKGGIFVPMIVVIVFFSITSSSTYMLMRQWRENVQIQILISECTAQTGLGIAESIERIENSSTMMNVLRPTYIPSKLHPPTHAGIKTALNILAKYQKFEKALWISKRGIWNFGAGCTKLLDRKTVFPYFPWKERPPDAMGPAPLAWNPRIKKDFALKLQRKSRNSVVRIYHDPNSKTKKWQVKWIAYQRKRLLAH